jgi:predicted Rdx family selenoprotein
VRVTQELLSRYQQRIESLTLLPGTRGVFDVEIVRGDRVDLIYSKDETGRQAHPGEVPAALDALIAAS